MLRRRGDRTASTALLEAVDVLEADGPSPELVVALERLAGLRVFSDSRAGADIAERAIAMASKLGLPEPIDALHYRGAARSDCGDAGGLDDMQRALAAAMERGSLDQVGRIHFNLAAEMWLLHGAAAALESRRQSQDFAERRGYTSMVDVCRAALAMDLIWAGEWEEALGLMSEADRTLEAAGNIYWLTILRGDEVLLRALRGEVEAARAMAPWVDERSHASEDPQGLLSAALALAVVSDAMKDTPGVRAALNAYERLVEHHAEGDYALRLPLAARLALRADDVSLTEKLAAHVEPLLPLYRCALASSQALLAEARDEFEEASADFADASSRWHDLGVPYEEAQALLGQGRCLLVLHRAGEARKPLAAAREIFERLGAKPALVETEKVLGALAGASQV